METQSHAIKDGELAAIYVRLEQKRKRSISRTNKEAQFDPETFYIMPFAQQRSVGHDGQIVYVPTERNLTPTGLRILDDCLRTVAQGDDPAEEVCRRYGLSAEGLAAVFHALTGRTYAEVRDALRLRVADDLLRYTDLPMSRLAQRAGFSTPQLYARVVKRLYGTSPGGRRAALRREGDLGRYAL